jgi:surface antigen
MVGRAYSTGLINWNQYQTAREKICRNAHGSWMFVYNTNETSEQ